MLHRSVDGRAARRFRRRIDGPMAAISSLHIERGGQPACLGVLAYVPVETRLRVCLAEGCTDKPPGAAMYFSLWLSALLLVLAVFAEQLQWLVVDPTPAALR